MASSNVLYGTIGKLVRSAREHAELTQDELAQRVGLTRTSITNIENGRQNIQVHTLYAIAEALNLPTSALLPSTSNETLRFEEVEGRLPEDLAPSEREWVKHVLTLPIG